MFASASCSSCGRENPGRLEHRVPLERPGRLVNPGLLECLEHPASPVFLNIPAVPSLCAHRHARAVEVRSLRAVPPPSSRERRAGSGSPSSPWFQLRFRLGAGWPQHMAHRHPPTGRHPASASGAAPTRRDRRRTSGRGIGQHRSSGAYRRERLSGWQMLLSTRLRRVPARNLPRPPLSSSLPCAMPFRSYDMVCEMDPSTGSVTWRKYPVSPQTRKVGTCRLFPLW